MCPMILNILRESSIYEKITMRWNSPNFEGTYYNCSCWHLVQNSNNCNGGVNLVDCGKFKLTAISYQSVADGNNFKEKILTYKIFGLVKNMYIVAE